jgi:hypothetical protein
MKTFLLFLSLAFLSGCGASVNSGGSSAALPPPPPVEHTITFKVWSDNESIKNGDVVYQIGDEPTYFTGVAFPWEAEVTAFDGDKIILNGSGHGDLINIEVDVDGVYAESDSESSSYGMNAVCHIYFILGE